MSKKKPTFKLGQPMSEAFNGMNPKEIMDNLEAVMYGKEEGEYTKHLTEEELAFAKSTFAETGIQIAKIEQEKKEAMAEFKDKLKEPKSEYNDLIETIKRKSIRKEGVLFLVDDPENSMMYKFD